MPSYLVETYEVSKGRAGEVDDTALRAGRAAEALSREGTPVLYVRETFLPADETYFDLFEAASDLDS